jgi:DNA-binding NarL/FixJ family response regulator
MGVPPARVTVRVAFQSPRRLLRDTLAACLAVRPDITVVGRVAEPDGILELCELRRPDVVILDAGLRLSEFAVRVRALLRRFPGLNVIVMYREASEQDLAAACRAGVASLLPESHGLAAVLALVQQSRGRHARPAEGGLTDRELEIVVLTGSGHSVPEIADLLRISPLTVENIKRRVYAKLDVSSGVHAVARAASFGLLDQRAVPAASRRPQAEDGTTVLTVVSGRPGAALDQVVTALIASRLPFVLVRVPGTVADTHWARWHRGPLVAALVDPGPLDWPVVAELGVPAVLVHSNSLDPPELAEALASGASALVAAGRVDAHFISVLRMVSQGYLVVDSMPMRPLIGAVRARWDERAPGRSELPELTSRESDILRSMARGDSIRQTAKALGIAPKTVENVQTRLFRKLGVRNRSGALAVADAFGLLPAQTLAQARDAAQARVPARPPVPAQARGAVRARDAAQAQACPPKVFPSPEGFSSLFWSDWRS